ncbi:MAG: DUF4412 domain-containing protein [Acidobacteria bacterium]|nr:DUF4412 domain-containing protein [Acidobacteriota bacterium]
MRKNTLLKSVVIGVVLLVAGTAWADVKVRTKNTMAGQSSESAVYVKGARQRSEMKMGPGITMTSVLQCDQKRIVQINDSCKVYMVTSTEEEEAPADSGAQPAAKPATTTPVKKTSRGGVITYISTTTDTNERKTLFGYVARHLKSSMKSESSPDACVKSDFRMEADGWYANLSVGLTCSGSAAMGRAAGAQQPDCQDRIRSRRTGPNPGFALQETRTIYGGGQSFTTTTETLELSKDTLDAGLFEIPTGYREVKSQQELMCMGDMQSMMTKAMKGEMSEEELEAAAAGAAAAAGSKSAGKGAGKLRIGVAGFVNKTKSTLAVESPRQRLIDEIITLDVDAVALDQTTPEEIVTEAREKKCDFILYTDVIKVKQAGGKLGGMFGKVTGGATGAGKYEVAVDFRLFPTGEDVARLESSASMKGEGEASEVVGSIMPDEARQAVTEARRKK